MNKSIFILNFAFSLSFSILASSQEKPKIEEQSVYQEITKYLPPVLSDLTHDYLLKNYYLYSNVPV